jgi:hypothetical protein
VVIDGNDACLIDWSCSCSIETSVAFSGTLHYAASEVLKSVKDGITSITYHAHHDLESLVYAIWELCSLKDSSLCTIPVRNVSAILAFWEREMYEYPGLKSLVSAARECEYDALVKSDMLMALTSRRAFA